ncbi:15330_t:CDS:1, partial [Funneliformis caledonium]
LLNDEIKQKSLMLQKSDKMLEEEITKNAKLQEELAQKLEMLRKNDQRFEDEAKEREELKIQLYLERKPLPALPKEENNTLTKQNTFKQLKTKTRVKVQQLQKLIKRKKFHSQALVTKIEVPVK